MATKGTDAGGKPGRVAQMVAAYKMTREQRPRIGLVLVGMFLVVFVGFLVAGYFLHKTVYLGVVGFMLGTMVTVVYFGRMVEKSAYDRIEGQIGAGANALATLRRGWTVDPAIAVTRNQDVVHRAVGRAGIVLVGEGLPSRVGSLLANEKRKHSRVAPDTPIYDVVVGDGDGQVPLRKLAQYVMKLPGNLRPAQVNDLKRRMKALEVTRQQVPIPKGPLPRNARLPKMPKPR